MYNEKYLLYLSLKVLKLIHADPTIISPLFSSSTIFNVFASFFCFLLAILYVFMVEAIRMQDVADQMVSCGTIGQCLVKSFVLLYHKNDLKYLIENMEKFWKINSDSGPLNAKLGRFFTVTGKVSKMFVIMAVTTVGTFSLKIFSSNPKLVINVWAPSDLSLKVVWLLQLPYIIFNTILVLGHDLLFVALCCNVIAQFKLLYNQFDSMNFREFTEGAVRKRLALCIEHHSFLIGFVKKMTKIYSILYLTQFVSVILSECTQFYFIFDSSKTSERIDQSVFAAIFLILQLGFYCFPASQILIEAESITDAVYGTDWYNSSIHLRKEILIILIQSQKQLAFTYGGLGIITRETFIHVLQTITSYVMIMRTFQKK